MAEIRAAFARLLRLTLVQPPFTPASLIHHSGCWPDFLTDFGARPYHINPARMLGELLADAGQLRVFLFRNFLPGRYGGDFHRYPAQETWLAGWLRQRAKGQSGGMTCLDAACGCGEGTYRLAELVATAGFSPGQIRITGATIEPFELFAAAHGYFPHDTGRQESFRRQALHCAPPDIAQRIDFIPLDLTKPEPRAGRYDLILCNGLLGGPMLHEERQLERVCAELSGLLADSGVVLAADRFHGGWKLMTPWRKLEGLLAAQGLATFPAGDGIGGMKPAP